LQEVSGVAGKYFRDKNKKLSKMYLVLTDDLRHAIKTFQVGK
jgi:hypothetical protein